MKSWALHLFKKEWDWSIPCIKISYRAFIIFVCLNICVSYNDGVYTDVKSWIKASNLLRSLHTKLKGTSWTASNSGGSVRLLTVKDWVRRGRRYNSIEWSSISRFGFFPWSKLPTSKSREMNMMHISWKDFSWRQVPFIINVYTYYCVYLGIWIIFAKEGYQIEKWHNDGSSYLSRVWANGPGPNQCSGTQNQGKRAQIKICLK